MSLSQPHYNLCDKTKNQPQGQAKLTEQNEENLPSRSQSTAQPRSLWLCSVMNTPARRALQRDASASMASTTTQLSAYLDQLSGESIEILVVESEAFLDLEFDSAEMVAMALPRLNPRPRYLLAVRTPGAASPKSQNAFAAEFSQMVDARTVVLVEDSVRNRPGPTSTKNSDAPSKEGGIQQIRQWGDLAEYVHSLLRGGPIRQPLTLPPEAVLLVAAFYRQLGSDVTWSRRHELILVGLAHHDSALLHKKVSYNPKTISNCFGEIARVLIENPGRQSRSLCCEIAAGYRGWLKSFGRRNNFQI
jgi:hypothetical protein